MDPIVCTACGGQIPAGSDFCPSCGAPVPSATPETATASPSLEEPSVTTPEPITAVEAARPTTPKSAPKRRKHRKRPLWARILCGFGSGILLTLAILIGIAAGAVQMVRQITSTDSIRDMIAEIDLPTLEITVNGEKQTVSQAIHEAFSEAQSQQSPDAESITPEQVDELLSADFVQDYLAETASSYAEALVEGTDANDLTPEEIGAFIQENRAGIEEILEVEITDEMIDKVTDELEETKVLEKLSVSNIIEEAPEVQTVVQTVTTIFSPSMALLFLAAMIFVLLLIALINFFRPISLTYAGVAFLVPGTIFGLFALLIDLLVDLLASAFSIPTSLLNIAVGGIVSSAFSVFLIGLIVGLLCIVGMIVYTVLRSVLRARAEQ